MEVEPNCFLWDENDLVKNQKGFERCLQVAPIPWLQRLFGVMMVSFMPLLNLHFQKLNKAKHLTPQVFDPLCKLL